MALGEDYHTQLRAFMPTLNGTTSILFIPERRWRHRLPQGFHITFSAEAPPEIIPDYQYIDIECREYQFVDKTRIACDFNAQLNILFIRKRV
jgi:hypothetical protein